MGKEHQPERREYLRNPPDGYGWKLEIPYGKLHFGR
jgi:hypothetical protein